MDREGQLERNLGLWSATGIGVGAIVGGGILALAGVAFATTGPSALLAFSLNGLIAVLTALAFAELSTAFPQSGGAYTFAKKTLSVEAAFAVGWVVWFASIVAAVLYAIGFGFFAGLLCNEITIVVWGQPISWLIDGRAEKVLALVATLFFAGALVFYRSPSGKWPNLGKIAVFGVLIFAGLWALRDRPPDSIRASLSPFFAAGLTGLVQAMGFTFIALQGFDLIAAVAGEVRDPVRTIPRAMLLSLATALAIYLPLLLIVSVVGVEPGQSITAASAADPEGIIAIAAQHYLGRFGYWLVVIAAVLSMLSALQANLFAASRVALAMSWDRTLPQVFAYTLGTRGTPLAAIAATALLVMVIVIFVRDVAVAGAAASLVFLVTFSLVHGLSIVARRRGRGETGFRAPLFPLVPLLGGTCCAGLALFQGRVVPSAGYIVATWLAIGGVLFIVLFARRARIVDASSEARDPDLVRWRGRSPLVLVPIANPAHAEAMVDVARALAPPEIGRVLLLSVVVPPQGWRPREDKTPLQHAQNVLSEALLASVSADICPEALTTVAAEPWPEIRRVARTHRCESVLLGLGHLDNQLEQLPIDALISDLECDVVVLHAHKSWQLSEAQRILVPQGGRGGHDQLRARLIGSLMRTGHRQVTFLRITPPDVSAQEKRKAERELELTAHDEAAGHASRLVVGHTKPATAIIEQAREADLLILGAQRAGGRKSSGRLALEVARNAPCPLILISHRG